MCIPLRCQLTRQQTPEAVRCLESYVHHCLPYTFCFLTLFPRASTILFLRQPSSSNVAPTRKNLLSSARTNRPGARLSSTFFTAIFIVRSPTYYDLPTPRCTYGTACISRMILILFHNDVVLKQFHLFDSRW
jgi:hypothetical protein